MDKRKCMSIIVATLMMINLFLCSQTSTVTAATYPPAKEINYACTGDQANDIVGIAKTQIGYVDNGVNTAYGAWYGVQTEWCAIFVSWCANKAGISTSIIPKLTTADRQWYKDRNIYKKSLYWGGNYTPKTGDIIFFSWSSVDYADHVGIVEKVSDGYVYTIEGNSSNSVARRSYSLKSSYILGYGVPTYKTTNTYVLRYSDGISSTTYDEDAKIIPSQTITSGVSTKTTSKKFTREGYHYDSWYIFKLINGEAHYWCREKGTDANPKWIKYNAIPSSYYKVNIAHGGSILFALKGETIYFTPVWEINTYTLRYSDGISSTSYDEDAKIIPSQTITSGVSTKTTSKKFAREGYHYDSWYIFKLINGVAHYWCREKGTDANPKWIKYNAIPSNYYKTSISHGGSLYFTLVDETIYLTPVWEKEAADVSKPIQTGGEGVYRIAGKDRFETSLRVANVLKTDMGVYKFDNIVIASGATFADALPGSYLAAQKDAPILLIGASNASQLKGYVNDNLKAGGKVYVLGGTGSIPEAWVSGMPKVERLGGTDRYETNLKILRAAGVTDGSEILVCTGWNFADSLSASAAGKPILLVGSSLSANQKAYLDEITDESYILIGGTGSVSTSVMNECRAYGSVERVAGSDRYATSVAVANRFFKNCDYAVLAYGMNFPDGLSAGPLAYNMKAPLILTGTGSEKEAATYAKNNDIKYGYVVGGAAGISDRSVRTIFQMSSSDSIKTK